MSSYYNIPEDVVFIILSLLPAKSLLRFITVCRLWQSIISNPKFINTHLINSQKTPTHIAILAKEDHKAYINTDEELIKLKLPPQCNNGKSGSPCSCNGLICLTDSCLAKIYIWNPLTKRLKTIPSPKKQYFLSKWYQYNVGFGLDSISNDYKILRMVECNSRLGFVSHAELYSSDADCWKEIQVPKLVSSSMILPHAKCIQLKPGILYMDRTRYMLSFDLHDEVFGVYPYPSGYKKKSSALKFEVYVAMIFESIADGSVSLWTLDDVCGGRKMSWLERFSLKADWKIDWVSFILRGGQILAQNYDFGCFLYDYKLMKVTKKVLTNIRASTSAVNYTGSLVALKGFEIHQ